MRRPMAPAPWRCPGGVASEGRAARVRRS
jgi:hypothetical protein